MELRPYEKHCLVHINRWRARRGLRPVEESDMPTSGFLAFVNDEPIAASFIRKCEGNISIMDSLITDPYAEGADRHEAIDLLTNRLIGLCRSIGMKAIICYSVDASTIERAKRHGFVEVKQTTMSKVLSGDEK